MHANIPFSTARLDGLPDDVGVDVLIVTSKHNIQYPLGGYYHFQFDSRRGFIKLEDTIAVTPNGYQTFGDGVRGWNRIPA